jgi:hypothetical protein
MTRPERVYQRLLAGDEDEAYEVAEVCLKEDSLLAAYDDVVLPALAMSENDTAEGLLSDDRESDVRAGMRRLIDALSQTAASDQKAEAAEAGTESTTPATPPATKRAAAATPATTNGAGNGAPHALSNARHHQRRRRSRGDPAGPRRSRRAGGLMLMHVLANNGYSVTNVSNNALASEMLDTVAELDPHAVLISATPPAAVSHVRYLLRRLTGKLSPDQTAIGVWAARTDAQTLRRRLDLKEMSLSTTLAEAVGNISRLTENARTLAVSGQP